MLIEAYAYEIDAIERAEHAHRRKYTNYPNDHWFCPEADCKTPVVPKRSSLGKFFYAGKRVLHHINCPHYIEPTEGDGQGEPNPGPEQEVPPLIPTILGETPQLPRRRFPHGPIDKNRLANEIRNAMTAPIGGTLEEVVNAFLFLSPEERGRHPLNVGGEISNYSAAFQNLDITRQLPDNWEVVVAYFRCRNSSGKAPGYFFLDSKLWFETENGRGPLHLMLATTRFSRENEKKYINDLLPGNDEILIFWNGGSPTEGLGHRNFPRINLAPHSEMPQKDQIALRAINGEQADD